MDSFSHHDPKFTEKLPPDCELYLVDGRMRVLSTSRRGLASEGCYLADLLASDGHNLAEVGELLACIEDMSQASELRLLLGSGSVRAVARRVSGFGGLSCLVLRSESGSADVETAGLAWEWAGSQANRLGMRSVPMVAHSVKILIVDDNPHSADYTTAMCRKLGCRSTKASTAGEAMALANRCYYDLALVDAWLPGMGAELLSKLLRERSLSFWGNEPLVATVLENERQALPRGGLCLVKPFALSSLSELISRARSHDIDDVPELEDLQPKPDPVLDLGLWKEDAEVLSRLCKALVAQGGELSKRLQEEVGYTESDSFASELRSIRSGCEVLHAGRLGKACVDVLECAEGASRSDQQLRLERLLLEIEVFRMFAVGNGLLYRN